MENLWSFVVTLLTKSKLQKISSPLTIKLQKKKYKIFYIFLGLNDYYYNFFFYKKKVFAKINTIPLITDPV